MKRGVAKMRKLEQKRKRDISGTKRKNRCQPFMSDSLLQTNMILLGG